MRSTSRYKRALTTHLKIVESAFVLNFSTMEPFTGWVNKQVSKQKPADFYGFCLIIV